MARSVTGSSLSRYASTDFESQPDPAFEGVNTEDLTADQIEQEAAKLEQEKKVIAHEIKLLEDYCEKFDIPEIVAAPETIEKLSTRKKKRQNQEKKLEKLTIAEKIEIVTKLIDSLTKTKSALYQSHEKKMEQSADDFEQLAEQTKEIQRASMEFERDIGKIAKTKGCADKFVRFHGNFIKQADAAIGKLKLKKQAMKDQLKRVNLSLKQKEETGDTLLEVDFNQLRIENQQFLERIDTQNQKLLFAKLKAGKCHSVLAQQQNGLHAAAATQERLEKKMRETEELNRLSKSQLIEVQQEVEAEKNARDQKKQIIASYEVPNIVDYVKQNKETQELQHSIEEWSRRVRIAEQENQMIKKRFSQIPV